MLVPLEGEIIPPNPAGRGASAAPVTSEIAVAHRSGGILIFVLCAALLGLAGAGGYYVWQRTEADDAAAAALAQAQHELGSLKSKVATIDAASESVRQKEAIGTLTKSVETLKAELDATRRASAAALAQANSRLDRLDQSAPDKVADAGARDAKPEANAARLIDLSARLDRIERQVSSPAATGSITPAPHAQVQASTQPVAAVDQAEKTPAKSGTLANWILRDVYDGIALVEGRGGGIREVAPGESLPGAGQVRSIERRGRAWIVVTSRGIIDDAAW